MKTSTTRCTTCSKKWLMKQVACFQILTAVERYPEALGTDGTYESVHGRTPFLAGVGGRPDAKKSMSAGVFWASKAKPPNDSAFEKLGAPALLPLLGPPRAELNRSYSARGFSPCQEFFLLPRSKVQGRPVLEDRCLRTGRTADERSRIEQLSCLGSRGRVDSAPGAVFRPAGWT